MHHIARKNRKQPGRIPAIFVYLLFFLLAGNVSAASYEEVADSAVLLSGNGENPPVSVYRSKSFVPAYKAANEFPVLQPDPVHEPFSRRFIHRIGTEARPTYIAPTHVFFRGENYLEKPMRFAFSGHLKYAFQFRPDTYDDRISGSAYQGIGMSGNTFFNTDELGNPLAVYLLQGARIHQFNPRLSLNYEWNFGLSFGWNPYADFNDKNRVVGSNLNAYINANFYLHWMLSQRFDLTGGISMTHFSNGSTKLPNAGINTLGLTLGLVYNFNRDFDRYYVPPPLPGPAFRRHMSYDLILFGAWRERGVQVEDGTVYAAPGSYSVFGFNFASMYNLGYKIRVGASLDGVYDGSANIYSEDHISGTLPEFITPPLEKQLSLGLSARADYVMPYFTITLGFGANFLHGGGDLKMFYQILALKINTGRNSFLHIGYSLKEFKSPNFLMLGVGYRFNNKPQTYRR